jgi:cytochrome c biogenesis protein CcmG, thiol:disulfide interchange protein DsbE
MGTMPDDSRVKQFSRARKSTLAAALSALCLVAGAAALARALEPGDRAPELSGASLDGQAISLATLRGKVVLIDFWASWCAPCKEEMPFIERLYRRLRSQGLIVVGVSVDAERENARDFIAQLKVSFPIVHDAKHAIADRFKPPRMPTSYVLDREGKIRHVHEGWRKEDEREVEQEITALLR